MADALHVGHQRRQSRAEQPRLLDRFRQRGTVRLAGSEGTSKPVARCSVTIVGAAAISTCCRTSAGRSKRPQLAAAIGTTIERVGNHLVDGFGRKVGPQVLLMAGLPAPLAILAVLSRRLGRFDQIAGGRLGGGRGVFLQAGNFRPQSSILRFQLLDASPQRRNRFRDHPPNILLCENTAHASFITSILPEPNTSFSPRERLRFMFHFGLGCTQCGSG